MNHKAINFIIIMIFTSVIYLSGFLIGYIVKRKTVSAEQKIIEGIIFIIIISGCIYEGFNIYNTGECNMDVGGFGSEDWDYGDNSAIFTGYIIISIGCLFGFTTKFFTIKMKETQKYQNKTALLVRFFCVLPVLFFVSGEAYGKFFWVRQLCEDWRYPYEDHRRWDACQLPGHRC